MIDSAGFEKSNWIKAQRLPKYFMEEAAFIESNLPLVLVNQPEIYEDRIVTGKAIFFRSKTWCQTIGAGVW